MGTQARLATLRDVRREQQSALMALADQLAQNPADESLNDQRRRLDRRLEQTDIEIEFIEDRHALIAAYTQQQHAALQEARAATVAAFRKIFEDRADFCETVVNDALHAVQEVPPLDTTALQKIQSDLAQAAREAKQTVDSINAAIRFSNRALDAVVMLARVAARMAI